MKDIGMKKLKSISDEEIANIIKLQATLTLIAMKKPVFFNIVFYMQHGLIKEHGKTPDNKCNWVITEKAKRILDIHL